MLKIKTQTNMKRTDAEKDLIKNSLKNVIELKQIHDIQNDADMDREIPFIISFTVFYTQGNKDKEWIFDINQN